MDESKELAELIDELVSKAGPTAGQVKLNQDPVKVARLKELGWTPAEKKPEYISAEGNHKAILQIQKELKGIQKTLIEQIKRIDECSIRR